VLAFFLLLMIVVVHDQQQTGNAIRVIAPNYEKSALEDRDYVFYTIQSGDTISMLERKFRVASPDAILKLNPDLDPDHLPVDQRIKIPLE
jgi:LysM repeat protein